MILSPIIGTCPSFFVLGSVIFAVAMASYKNSEWHWSQQREGLKAASAQNCLSYYSQTFNRRGCSAEVIICWYPTSSSARVVLYVSMAVK